MFNRLQQFAEPLSPTIAGLFDLLQFEFSRLNCLGHQMSGSGSSYFGVFSNVRIARLAARRLSSRLPHVRIISSQTLIRTATI
jgi:4-diphosphocytidyl-2-C-methyl-D-erythritol kinase